MINECVQKHIFLCKIIIKSTMSYNCKTFNFSTERKTDLHRHLKTNKHLKKSSNQIPRTSKKKVKCICGAKVSPHYIKIHKTKNKHNKKMNDMYVDNIFDGNNWRIGRTNEHLQMTC